MAYKDMLLPACVDLTWVSGSGFMTQVVVLANGTEARNQAWAYNRGRYKVSYNARRAAGWQEFQAFFGVAAGMANTWRLRDPSDNVCLAADGKFIAIDATHVQMVKRYTFSGLTFDSIITKPDSTVTLTGGGTLSTSTGIVTYSGSPPTAWAGKFYRHCRFDVDALAIDGIDKSPSGGLIAGWRDVPIVEVRGE